MKHSMMNFIPLLFTFLLFTGCDTDPVIPIDDCPNPPCSEDPPPSKIGILDTLWSVPIGDHYGGTNHIEVIDGVVYFSVGATIIAYNALTSEELWRWEEQELGRHITFYICGNEEAVFVQNFRDIAAVNLKNGTTSKRFTENKNGCTASPRGALLGDYYYYVRRCNSNSLAVIRRTQKNDFENWEDLYILKQGEDTGGSRPNIESYNLWVNPTNGDSVLVFQHRMSIPNRVDIVAFSLNSREILWRQNDINVSGNSNHQQMLVMNDKVYIMAAEVVIAYDIFTGEVVWEHFNPTMRIGFMFHKFEYAESIDALIVKGGTPRLYGLDPETGAEKLFIPDATDNSVSSGSPSYHNGIIYYNTSSYLHAVRATTGEMLWKERSFMNTNSGFNGDIGIDEDNGLLFAADGYYLFAIKMYGH